MKVIVDGMMTAVMRDGTRTVLKSTIWNIASEIIVRPLVKVILVREEHVEKA